MFKFSWKNDIDWEKVFGVIFATDNLKRNQTRPLRTEIVELAIEKYSNGKLKYVGDKKDGLDFLVVSTNERIECKMKEVIFPVKSSTLHTGLIIEKNFQGKKQEVKELKQTYDTMVMIDVKKCRVGICSWDDGIRATTDATSTVRFPVQKCNIIVDGVVPDPILSAKDFNSIIFETIMREI